MKKKLAPCGSCKRHVRITETACPFCAVLFAAALGLVGCDDTTKSTPTATSASGDLAKTAAPSASSAAPSATTVASGSTTAAPAVSEPTPTPSVSASGSASAMASASGSVKPTPAIIKPRPAVKYGLAPMD
jgi:hypothetical protein